MFPARRCHAASIMLPPCRCHIAALSPQCRRCIGSCLVRGEGKTTSNCRRHRPRQWPLLHVWASLAKHMLVFSSSFRTQAGSLRHPLPPRPNTTCDNCRPNPSSFDGDMRRPMSSPLNQELESLFSAGVFQKEPEECAEVIGRTDACDLKLCKPSEAEWTRRVQIGHTRGARTSPRTRQWHTCVACNRGGHEGRALGPCLWGMRSGHALLAHTRARSEAPCGSDLQTHSCVSDARDLSHPSLQMRRRIGAEGAPHETMGTSHESLVRKLLRRPTDLLTPLWHLHDGRPHLANLEDQHQCRQTMPSWSCVHPSIDYAYRLGRRRLTTCLAWANGFSKHGKLTGWLHPTCRNSLYLRMTDIHGFVAQS